MARDVPTAAARRRLAVLEPVGEVFVNGLASWYDDEFPRSDECAQLLTRDEFASAMTKINEALTDHWPCMPLTSFAYGCCICTLGLSFYCATTQVDEAEQRARMQIRRVNEQDNFKRKGVEFRLVRIWYKRASFIEISVATTAAAATASSSDVLHSDTAPAMQVQEQAPEAPASQTMSDRLV